MQIGIDQIVNIGENVVVDPKKLLCSICFTLNIDARECLNKKCKKLFCINCINSLKNVKNIDSDNSNNKIPCPFCRVEADFYKAEENLNKLISELMFDCLDNCCTGKFSLEELIEHKKSKKNLKYCYKCKDSTFLNYTKCYSCQNIFCNDCNYTQNCLNCEFSICNNCISGNFKNKENFLCGICEPICSGCQKNIDKQSQNQEASEICSFCSKLFCDDCLKECKDCNLKFCKDEKYCKEYCEHMLNQNNENGICRHKISLECEICFPRCKYKINENSSQEENKENQKIKTNRSKFEIYYFYLMIPNFYK